METIVLICHPADRMTAKLLTAGMRQLLAIDEYLVWQKSDDLTAGDTVGRQVSLQLQSAAAVLVLFGGNGVDPEFERQHAEDVRLRIQGRDTKPFSTLLLKLPSETVPPPFLASWVSVEIDAAATGAAAQEIVTKLGIRPRWQDSIDIDAAIGCLPRGAAGHELVRHLKDVAQMLSDGKPLTMMLGPYASVEERDDGSCPSRVRRRLLEMIDDHELRTLLLPLAEAAEIGALPPILWQDHLATLCLLSGRSRDEIADAIDQCLDEAGGDGRGAPTRPFAAVAQLASALKAARLQRTAGLPAVTLLTVCPGMRVERALVASGCRFERAALKLDRSAQPQVHRAVYEPTQQNRLRAIDGAGYRAYMPEEEQLKPAGQTEFVRLVKLFGSRDLDFGVPSGHLGEAYQLLGELRALLADFVDAAGRGPYLLLGGGLVTPLVQAAHAMLLRHALDKPERRPRLAIVPAQSASPDPSRRAEAGRLRRLTTVPSSGFDRLSLVTGDPTCFIEALTVALGGSVERVRPAPLDSAAA